MKPNIQKAELKITAGDPRQFPRDPIPQIAFSGRSNVGKSSLVNSLLGRKSLARVSSSPGKTITVNFYDVDRKLYLVDLPGYGFAKRTFEEKKKWSALTDGYFTKNKHADLLRLRAEVGRHSRAGGFIGGGTLLADGVNAPVHIGPAQLNAAHRVPYRLGHLGRGGIIQIDQRPTMYLTGQRRADLPHGIDIKHRVRSFFTAWATLLPAGRRRDFPSASAIR